MTTDRKIARRQALSLAAGAAGDAVVLGQVGGRAVNRRLGVCSWSLRPEGPRGLVNKVKAAGLSAVQLALDPIREKTWKEAETRDALRAGGTMAACLNAANEELVAGFLAGRMRFTDLPRYLETVMERHDNVPAQSLEDLIEIDGWARAAARELIGMERAAARA